MVESRKKVSTHAFRRHLSEADVITIEVSAYQAYDKNKVWTEQYQDHYLTLVTCVGNCYYLAVVFKVYYIYPKISGY